MSSEASVVDPFISVSDNSPTGRTSRQRGFTLIEMVIVMAIIALLAALVGPQLFGKLDDSKIKSTKAQIEMLSTALDTFRLDNGRYPNMQEGLQVLVERPTGTNLPKWAGPYLKKSELPKDAWGHDFVYTIPPAKGGVDYDLISLGPDDKPDSDKIITNN